MYVHIYIHIYMSIVPLSPSKASPRYCAIGIRRQPARELTRLAVDWG